MRLFPKLILSSVSILLASVHLSAQNGVSSLPSNLSSSYSYVLSRTMTNASGTASLDHVDYDENGNLTKDLNKNISSIQYNLLNLPASITYSTGKSAAYIYDAGGKKLKVSYKNSATATAVPTDYCGNMIYENNVLKQILIDGGYVTFSGSTPQYHFYLKDHLGNNRVVVNASGTKEQVNHYYPFGGLFGESTSGDTQGYKYNGKELDRMHGLDWYDYGARHMDGMRFTTIDPLAEKYYSISPYAYCANNPINAIDPDGRSIWGKGLKLAWKVGKAVVKDGVKALGNIETYASAFEDIKEDTNTLFDSNSSTWDKIKAGASIASELLPLSAGDAKSIGRAAKKTYQTYIKNNPITGKKYAGRTSGKGTPLENVKRRDRNHHMNKEGYGPAELDKSSSNPDAIRGQEQYLIDKNGGAQSQGGTSGNKINGVSSNNPKRMQYEQAREKEFDK